MSCSPQVSRVVTPYMVDPNRSSKSSMDRAINQHNEQNAKANAQLYSAQGIHTHESKAMDIDQHGGKYSHNYDPTSYSESYSSEESSLNFSESSSGMSESSVSMSDSSVLSDNSFSSVSQGIPRLGNNTIPQKGIEVYSGTKTNPGPFTMKCDSQTGGSGYSMIVNPETGRRVSIYGKIGQAVLKKYVSHING